MPIVFSDLHAGALRGFSGTIADGAVIGLVGASGSGTLDVLAQCEAHGAIVFGPADLAELDGLERAHLPNRLFCIRSEQRIAVLASHELEFLQEIVDEIWWVRDGALAAKGDPAEMIPAYKRALLASVRAGANGMVASIQPSLRRGDGRASLVSIETLGADGNRTRVWQSGEEVAVRIVVRFSEAVDNPVVGMLIRTRIGLEVYGTNTELEGVRVGPCQPGDEREVLFRFRCDLCPKEYTITAASHDPDGVWHDWMEDAVAFTVADSRYTAGVSNLRAAVSVRELKPSDR
ncbi:MAG TPA: Wzt carbohydrate-binding domain-containing protein [Bryobacteraceae bacterium]|nr:Wzt carbohydrate-binding domain-containing protein [Bryobacteraceae bacterium]